MLPARRQTAARIATVKSRWSRAMFRNSASDSTRAAILAGGRKLRSNRKAQGVSEVEWIARVNPSTQLQRFTRVDRPRLERGGTSSRGVGYRAFHTLPPQMTRMHCRADDASSVISSTYGPSVLDTLLFTPTTVHRTLPPPRLAQLGFPTAVCPSFWNPPQLLPLY